jgi:hypothetical protein
MANASIQARYRQMDRELLQIEAYLDSLAQDVQQVTGAVHASNPAWIWTPTSQVKAEIELLRKELANALGVEELGPFQ